MGGMIVFVLFFAFLFGATILMLTQGYINTEKRRAEEQREREAEEARLAQAMAVMPRFFAKPESDGLPANPAAFDEALLADLESYVRSEQAVVSQFVDEPSIDSLYRQPSASVEIN